MQRRKDDRKINIDVREIGQDHIKFVLSGVDLSVANSYRRIMMMEIPTIAIEVVDFESNSSVLNDEYLAHRFGLVPLVSDCADQMKSPLETDDDHDFTDVILTLSVRNDGDYGTMMVTSDNFVLDDKHGDVHPVGYRGHTRSRNNDDGTGSMVGEKAIKPILLCKLGKNQDLSVICTARKGIGKDHAKFSPVSLATFQTMPIVRLNHSLLATMSIEEKVDWVESCPTNVFKVDNITGEIEVENPEAYMYDRESIIKAEEMGKPGLVEITEKLDTFIFTVETTGQLSPEKVVIDGLSILKSKLRTLRTSVSDGELMAGP